MRKEERPPIKRKEDDREVYAFMPLSKVQKNIAELQHLANMLGKYYAGTINENDEFILKILQYKSLLYTLF